MPDLGQGLGDHRFILQWDLPGALYSTFYWKWVRWETWRPVIQASYVLRRFVEDEVGRTSSDA